MKDVNIYLKNGVRGPRPGDGHVIYILEFKTPKGPVTRSEVKKIEKTSCHRAELIALSAALSRLKEKCSLIIYTDSSYLTMAMNSWISNWIDRGWKNFQGEEISNRDLWQELLNQISGHTYEFRLKETHAYSSWMVAELERRKNV